MGRIPEKRYDSAKGGVGQITAHVDGKDIFFHVRSVEDGGPVLKSGQTVTYDLMQGPDGQYYAINIEVIDEPE